LLSEFFAIPIPYLPSNHDSTRGEAGSRIALDAVVQCDDVQTVEELTFILVDSFNLHLQKAYDSLIPFSYKITKMYQEVLRLKYLL
jgi:hypothetical protein